MTRNRTQDGIVSFSGENDGDLVPLESYSPFSFNKEPVDLECTVPILLIFSILNFHNLILGSK